ncbi:MAG: hypothetical protein ACI97B_004187, partial [Verrucomicrobiales bacterium]
SLLPSSFLPPSSLLRSSLLPSPMRTVFMLITFLFLGLSDTHAAEREITVRLAVPDGNWQVKIQEVYETDEEVWVIAALERREGFGIQAISKAGNTLKLEAPEHPLKVFITGKRWGWNNAEPYTFVKNPAELVKKLKGKKRIYPIAKK